MPTRGEDAPSARYFLPDRDNAARRDCGALECRAHRGTVQVSMPLYPQLRSARAQRSEGSGVSCAICQHPAGCVCPALARRMKRLCVGLMRTRRGGNDQAARSRRRSPQARISGSTDRLRPPSVQAPLGISSHGVHRVRRKRDPMCAQPARRVSRCPARLDSGSQRCKGRWVCRCAGAAAMILPDAGQNFHVPTA